jgi:hypothetical protein
MREDRACFPPSSESVPLAQRLCARQNLAAFTALVLLLLFENIVELSISVTVQQTKNVCCRALEIISILKPTLIFQP